MDIIRRNWGKEQNCAREPVVLQNLCNPPDFAKPAKEHWHSASARLDLWLSTMPSCPIYGTPMMGLLCSFRYVSQDALGYSSSSRCCHRHDCCYDKAEKEGCNPKVQRYQWECEQNAVRCDNLTDRCEKMACLCDQEAARCWGAAPYNPHFILWPDFLCGQTHPTCHFRYGGAE
ncbi:group 10 secretory phospholipase A2 [Columba guinea]|nr:group 10 secretory phospholipase A2 [Columba guinea]